MGDVEIVRMNAIRNAALNTAADLLAAYTDEQLLEALLALGADASFPPLWEMPLSLELQVLIAPTLDAELARRWEVRALEAAAE